jgi:hypothetical protein
MRIFSRETGNSHISLRPFLSLSPLSLLSLTQWTSANNDNNNNLIKNININQAVIDQVAEWIGQQ